MSMASCLDIWELCPQKWDSRQLGLFCHVQCYWTAESPRRLIVVLKCYVVREPLRAPAANSSKRSHLSSPARLQLSTSRPQLSVQVLQWLGLHAHFVLSFWLKPFRMKVLVRLWFNAIWYLRALIHLIWIIVWRACRMAMYHLLSVTFAFKVLLNVS